MGRPKFTNSCLAYLMLRTDGGPQTDPSINEIAIIADSVDRLWKSHEPANWR